VSALIGFAAVGAVLVVTLLTANANGISTIGRAFSFILFGGFVAYTIWSLKYSSADDEEEYEISGRGMPFLAAQLFFGAVAMAVLADVTVDNAVILAGTLGIPTAVVGATVIAAGGSLPEVFACIAAARMGRPKIVVGNIVGSQIFNLLGILGVSGLVGAFTFNSTISVDIAILLAITVVFLLSFQVAAIRRHLGVLMVGSYLGYAAYLISISV